MRIGLSSNKILESKNDIVLFLTEEQVKSIIKSAKSDFDKLISKQLKLSSFKGKVGSTLTVFVANKPFNRIIISGLGKKARLDLEVIRRAASSSFDVASKLKLTSLSVASPESEFFEREVVRALSDGLMLSNYKFDKYKTKKDSKLFLISNIKIYVSKVTKDLKDAIIYSEITCNATNFARDLQSENADDMNPGMMVKVAKSIAKKNKLKIKIINKKQLQKLGLNLHLAVSQGSRFEPALIILEYNGKKTSKENTAIVGKGITFDSGGLGIKTRWMNEMNMDMSGAAIVLATIKAVAELKLKKNIIAVAPVCENAVGSTAYKPGTVIKSYLGKTVEIGHTDAEGRLILADALAYTNKNYKPSQIIDIATLTGSIMSALGHKYAGVFSTNEEMIFKLKVAGKSSGDLLWKMPLPKDYAKYLKSEKADLNNISNYSVGGIGLAGSITAALFLKEFVNKTPWTHIDVAGAAMYNKKRFYRPKDGTGFGVRLLCDYFSQK